MPKTNSNHSMKLAKKVLSKLKNEITTSNDIIPFVDMPFFFGTEKDKYIKKFGSNKVLAYEKHNILLTKLRSLVNKLYPSYKDSIVSPLTTLKIATSMCGVGECDETSQRSVMELVNMGCKEEVNLVLVTGKPRVRFPNPQNPNDYYGHVFVIIGNISTPFDPNPKLFFENLPDTHVLLDPLLKIVDVANKTTKVLEKVFKILEINKVSTVIGTDPAANLANCQAIQRHAKIISEYCSNKLQITNINKSFRQDMFFSHPLNKYKENDNEHRSLLVSEEKLDWNTCMELYRTKFGI